jgi:hypothetical protein
MMAQDNSFIRFLDALFSRQGALFSMQYCIGEGDFESAMDYHFDYLYWDDEVKRLLDRHTDAYLEILQSLRS